MGTTLTGTKPKDTYDSLIKVTDNGPISGTAKYLSDGLGNDLPIAVSTSNVGIGTSTPLAKLNIADAALTTLALTATGEATDQKNWVYQYGAAVGAGTFRLRASNDAASTGQNAVIITRTGFNVDTHQFLTSGSERVRITDNGLTFNGDTAAANALDDYEEGTWTPVFRGTTTAGTYSYSAGVSGGGYRKIGSQVTVWASMIDIVESSAGSGDWEIAGLPFTVANNTTFSRANGNLYVRQSAAARSSLTILFSNNATVLYPVYNNGSASASSFTIAADFTTNMDIGFVITYFV